MITLDINYTQYIPSTVIGLVGLLFTYLYYYFRNKDDKKLKEIESTKKEDRLSAIEANLNEMGVHFDTSTLNSKQKFELLNNTLKTKTRKYLIVALTTIILSMVISLLIWKTTYSNHDQLVIVKPSQDSTKYKTIINRADSLLLIAQQNLDLENVNKPNSEKKLILSFSIVRLKNIKASPFDSLMQNNSVYEILTDIENQINR